MNELGHKTFNIHKCTENTLYTTRIYLQCQRGSLINWLHNGWCCFCFRIKVRIIRHFTHSILYKLDVIEIMAKKHLSNLSKHTKHFDFGLRSQIRWID